MLTSIPLNAAFYMPLKKGHKYRWESKNEESLDKSPICFKGRVGQKQKLKNIPDWQEILRDFLAQLILENDD
ncbi:hypothetical protein [Nostoc sp.]|uniref:hypothetical protein n=1 Tax=Nostoc sp. TaxID=1180 RepID=UPI002FF6BB2C